MLSGPRKPQRLAVFISGGGSTLQALLEMHHQLEISLIVSNRKNALGLLKARRFGKKTVFFDKQMSFSDLSKILIAHNIEVIMLAGFMKLLPADFVEQWQGRIFNIHPSLLPAYPGLNSAEKSWDDNFDMGVSIHAVNEQMDAGKIILRQRSLPAPRSFQLAEALVFLRRTEQFLLRELALRWLR